MCCRDNFVAGAEDRRKERTARFVCICREVAAACEERRHHGCGCGCNHVWGARCEED